MRQFYIIFFISFFNLLACGQSIGIGTATPNASAALDISDTTKGLLMPRMTTLQRDAIVNPEHGLLLKRNNLY